VIWIAEFAEEAQRILFAVLVVDRNYVEPSILGLLLQDRMLLAAGYTRRQRR
jgi:hypothetical protein